MSNLTLLSTTERRLLGEILKRTSKVRAGVDAARFNVEHENDIEALTELANSRFLERRDDRYFIRLLGLAELASTHPAASNLLYLCSHVFAVIRRHYKHHPGEQLTVGNLAREADLPKGDVRCALDYLLEPGIWGGRSTDLDGPNSYVIPGERILYYKSLDAIVKELRGWALASPPTAAVLLRRGTKRKPAAAQPPSWHASLPKEMRVLLDEVYTSVHAGQRALPAMGLRAVIELMLNELVGDVGNFTVKLAKLVELQLITEQKRQVLQNLLEVGHASAHRGHVPPRRDVNDALECVETVIHDLLILDKTAARLRAAAPARSRQRKQDTRAHPDLPARDDA